jgi:hypothetical protein
MANELEEALQREDIAEDVGGPESRSNTAVGPNRNNSLANHSQLYCGLPSTALI